MRNSFIQSQVDACVYIREDDDNKILIVVWVDDIVIAASSIKLMNEAKELLKENFKMKDLGPISSWESNLNRTVLGWKCPSHII